MTKDLFSNKKRNWLFIISFLYIIINTILISKEFYYFSVLPFFIAVLIIYFFALDKLLMIITFMTPLSITLSELGFDIGVNLAIPTEPLMIGLLLIFIFLMLWKNPLDKKIIRHPVSIIIMLQLFWMLICSLSSELPLVSFKYLLSRLWFVVPFYFLAVQVFKNKKNIEIFAWVFAIPLCGVVAYTSILHAGYGFDSEVGHWIMSPFFNDHTAYGAVLAMFVVVFFGFTLNRNKGFYYRFYSGFVFIILLVGLFLSASRAAWLSVVAALGVYMLIRLRIKFIYVVGVFLLMLAMFFTMQDKILYQMSKNDQDSSGDVTEHVRSMSNISTDASNLERLNRWNSAFRMWKERPILGWGPGVYQFKYAPFQSSRSVTLISTNVGNRGNAHSEYIGPLSEQGVFGMLIVLVLFLTVILSAINYIKKHRGTENAYLIMLFMLGLITYYIHGLLNNFLDTDKGSVPVWGFTAIIVALQLFHNEDVSLEELENDEVIALNNENDE